MSNPHHRLTGGIRSGAALVAAVAVLAVAPAGRAATSWSSVSKPYPGIVIRKGRNSGSNVFVAKISLCEARVHVAATAPPASYRTPGGWGASVGVQLAVNGDFFFTGPSVYGEAVGAGKPWPQGQANTDPNNRGGWIGFGDDWVEFSYTRFVKRNGLGRYGWYPGQLTDDVPEGTRALVSGFSQLVIDGQPVTCSSLTSTDCFHDRGDLRDLHPRTAMGLSQDRKRFILAVVDGRSASSRGMNGVELAAFMHELGAFEAFNIDGGGSSAMWLAGSGYLNRPSDGTARAVVNHWGIYAGAVGGKPATPGSCFVAGGCFPTAVVGAEKSAFKDMPTTQGGYEQARLLQQQDKFDLCQSQPAPLFCPRCAVRRGKLVTFIVRALGLRRKAPPATPTFVDVPADAPNAAAIEAAARAGFAQPCNQAGTKFCPDDPATRVEAAIMLRKAAGFPLVDPAKPSFSDVPKDHPRYRVVEALKAKCAIGGCGNGTFCPGDPLTRAAAAVWIVKTFNVDGKNRCLVELCNGKDDDFDGDVDEGCVTTPPDAGAGDDAGIDPPGEDDDAGVDPSEDDAGPEPVTDGGVGEPDEAGGGTGTPDDPGAEGGCACALQAHAPASSALTLGLLALLLLALRRVSRRGLPGRCALLWLAVAACSADRSRSDDARPADDLRRAGDGSADLGFADAPAPPDAGPACSPGNASGALPATDGLAVVVAADQEKFALSPVLQGANINQWFGHANGLWDAEADAPVANAVAKAARAGLGLLRFPGGTCANLFDWKRAVGPRAQRGCQTDAGDSPVARLELEYGPSEFIRLVRAIGAEPQIMMPFANESPADAADWVEYMNAPVGTNPNGGVAWAEVREADGSAAPYGVTRWEIGNEHDRGGHQAYWMTRGSSAAEDRARIDEYVAGAERSFVDQPMGRECDFTDPTTAGAANETFYLLYGLIKPGTVPRVKVDGVAWKQVANLAAAGPTDQVYTLDLGRSSITFGDGIHGALPPKGKQVTASYTFKHEGFVAMYDAMKATAAAIGTPISVCAAWAPPDPRGTASDAMGQPSFAAEMKRRGLGDRYDCVAMHPYTNFGRDFGDAWDNPAEGHHEHMLGDGWARAMVAGLRDDLQANGSPAFITISELGALWFGGTGGEGGAALPEHSATMTHALYMASQWIHYARLKLGWVEGNTLVANPNGLRGTLGGSATGFVYGAEALTREALKPFFADGSTWVGSRVEAQEQVTAPGGESYPALVVGASLGADGALRVAVVNRRMVNEQLARVAPGGFVHGAEVEVTTVRGASFASYNDDAPDGGDDSVKINHTTLTVSTADFDHAFPAASVTVLTLRPPCP